MIKEYRKLEQRRFVDFHDGKAIKEDGDKLEAILAAMWIDAGNFEDMNLLRSLKVFSILLKWAIN